MSLRDEMLDAASSARDMLQDCADLVVEFLRGRISLDGGFRGRSDTSDLYYTVFGLDALAALDAEPPGEATRRYLDGFADGEGLDLVHLACLARCRAALAEPPDPVMTRRCFERMQAYAAPGGGYSHMAAGGRCTAYGCFLAVGACEDLQLDSPQMEEVAAALAGLRCDDGSYANEVAVRKGSVPATAAVVTLLRHLQRRREFEAERWLLSQVRPAGGFAAGPWAPAPDLLSTATALHALVGNDAFPEERREDCLNFLDSLWSSRGGFHGHWGDEELDTEFIFYGLLALGCLSRTNRDTPAVALERRQ